EGKVNIAHERDSPQTRRDFTQEREALTRKIERLERQAGGVASRARKAVDDAGSDGIRHSCEDDRDDRCRLLDPQNDKGSRRDDDMDLERHKVGSVLAVALAGALRPAILDCNGSFLDPTKFAQSLYEGSSPGCLRRR